MRGVAMAVRGLLGQAQAKALEAEVTLTVLTSAAEAICRAQAQLAENLFGAAGAAVAVVLLVDLRHLLVLAVLAALRLAEPLALHLQAAAAEQIPEPLPALALMGKSS